MRKSRRFILISTAVSIMEATLFGHPPTDHVPRDGDRLHPGLADSRALILSVCDSARTVTLNHNAVSFDDSKDASVYVDGDTISYVQSATKHRFILRSDTLTYIGYENRATDFRLDRPARVAVLPLREGGDISDTWSGHMLHHGAMVLRHVKGASSSSVRSGWTLTDGTDTIHDATRLAWTLDMAYADPGSITPGMPDSVASDMVSGMRVDLKAALSERLLTGRTLWFTEDARYPVLTDNRVSRVSLDEDGNPTDTVTVSALAMHYPAPYQYSDTGEEFQPDLQSGSLAGDCHASYGGGVSPHRPLTVGEPEVSSGTVRVTLTSQSGPVTATVTLLSESGLMLSPPLEVEVGIIPQSVDLRMSGDWSGVMLLRVEEGGGGYTRKIIRQ